MPRHLPESMTHHPFSRSRWTARSGTWLTAVVLGLLGCANAEVSAPEPTRDASAKDGPTDGGGPDEKIQKSDGSADSAPAGVCAPFSNSGCDSDKKCTALQSGSTLSLGCGDKGDKAEGDDCATTSSNDQPTGDDCGNGLACLLLASDTTSKCRRLCPASGTANACPTGEVCILQLPGVTGYLFCRPSCKPLEQTGCDPDKKEACYLSNVGAKCLVHPDTPTKIGESCSSSSECEPGSTCLTFSSGNKCLKFCSTSGGSPSCPSGSTCTKVPVDDVFMSEPNVGTCK
jgi:hypothetical protein